MKLPNAERAVVDIRKLRDNCFDLARFEIEKRIGGCEGTNSMKLREQVRLEGIPIVWETNLSDGEIRAFYPYPGYLVEEALWTFSAFPEATEGIQFLREYAGWSSPFIQYANRYRSLHSQGDEDWKTEVDKIFREASDKFPADGFMHKEICLFWERGGDLGRAKECCQLAASRALLDDTKTGFAGRLKRLQKKIHVAFPSGYC
jgi:hypothetical protein